MKNDTISKMVFIIIDQTNKNIFDINYSRKSLDLYKPYYDIMSLFRNPDRFYIVIQFRNALDKLCNKSNKNYKKLKKYERLYFKYF